MAQKYELKYRDIVNVWHELQIYDDDYSDSIIEIQGRIFLDSPGTDDHLEAIRGMGLRVELEADSDLTFSDLYSDEEQTFRVVYLRDSVQLFEGWINSEGFFEDMVNTEWRVTFDCVDGLSYLENRSFVETDGTRISGRISQLDALVKALARTGLEKNIYISIDIFYTGLSTSVQVLDNVYMATNRFVRDDDRTTMSCEEVIRATLEPYGAILKSYGDGWYIYKPNQVYLLRYQNFWAYDYEGTPISGFGLDMSEDLGSHINNFYPHHVNENQSLGIERSLGAHRINYKYGEPESFYENELLISDNGYTVDDWNLPEADSGTTDGTTATKLVDSTQNFLTTVAVNDIVHNTTDGTYSRVGLVDSDTVLSLTNDIMVSGEAYTIYTATNIRTNFQVPFLIGEGGITMDYVATGNSFIQLEADYITVTDDSLHTFELTFTDDSATGDGNLLVKVIMTDDPTTPTVTYELQDDMSWSSSVSNSLTFSDMDYTGEIKWSFIPDEKPVGLAGNGYMYLKIWTPVMNPPVGTFTFNRIRAYLSIADSTPNGEYHTFQRETKPSAKVDDVKDVTVGDNPFGLWGALYKADTITATTTWFRKGFSESKKLLQLMGEERMRMSQSPARTYSGDVYGYINFLDVYSIDGVDGLFMITEYSYDTYQNVTSLEMKQIQGDELTDLDYKETPDADTVVKPTIKG